MTNKDTPAERDAIAALRAKMGPLLRTDDEARAMLFGLVNNPAVQVFAAHFERGDHLKETHHGG